ncbi:preprotein translocase subunit SecE [Tepidibacillus infernus]|uniref:Protein translocase subunit SecE n=1 Tax=Tepidibacillus decaturensis TaxID=1413211 RepID=A0A135L7E8_9BACI|nr:MULTISPECIES: preprotein translocase subunit SecE [Tepidibacillus]KXG44886.1 preprotein translocase subunit SecE [Tepidibacillus decaturensis]GBF12021.1 preprotein translocase subunit SecE [Tepidibacillus sp. HK-1]
MGFLNKIKNGFTSTIDFIRDGIRELKKVRWPNRKELVSYTTIVVSTVVFVTVFFFVVDLGISSLLQLIGLGK